MEGHRRLTVTPYCSHSPTLAGLVLLGCGMDKEGSLRLQEKRWNKAETHALLDLIRDLGLMGLLSRKGFQNWDVFERLHALLKRCNIHFSPGQIKARWQKLKLKYLRLKRFMVMGASPGLLADFPYYEELEQLLGAAPQTQGPCRREADSSGLSSTTELQQKTTLGDAVAPQLEAAMWLDDGAPLLEEPNEAGGFSLSPAPEENSSTAQEILLQRNPSQSAGAVGDHLQELLVGLCLLETVLHLTATTLEHVVLMCKETISQLESVCSPIVGREGVLETGPPSTMGAVENPTPVPLEAPQPELSIGSTAERQSLAATTPQRSRKPGSMTAGVCPVPRRSKRERRPSVRYRQY